MRWIRGISDLQIITDDGRYKINKERGGFSVFGPPGSQDVSFITPRPSNPGRRMIGFYRTADEARAACEATDALTG